MNNPLNAQLKFSLKKKVATKNIISTYKQTYGIDVERFFRTLSEIELHKCSTTGYEFYLPTSIEGDNLFYQDMQKTGNYYPEWKWEHEVIKKFIIEQKKGTILEIGCAEGTFIEKIQQELPHTKVVGLELNSEAAKTAQAKNLDVKTISLEQHTKNQQEQYDIVCSFQVMEHIAQVGNVIESSLQVLKKGGYLVISVPNNDSYLGFDELNPLNYPPHHVGRWNIRSLKTLPKVFPSIKLSKILLEPLRNDHISYRSQIMYKIQFQKFKKRVEQMGIIGKIINKAEDKLSNFLYPTFDNMTAVAIYKKL